MKINKIKRMTWIFIVSAATAILALISGYLQYKEKIDTTEKALLKEEELQKKTQEIADLNKEIYRAQTKIIIDNEREKNPLFPMKASIRLKFPFESNAIPKRFLDTIYKLKNEIESGADYQRRELEVTWNPGRKEIHDIGIIGPYINSLNSVIPLGFLASINFEIKLRQHQTDSLSDNLPSIFSIYYTLRQDSKLEPNTYKLYVNFEKKEIYLTARFENFYHNELVDFASLGTLDLYNRFLFIQIPKLCQYEIDYLMLYGENSRSGYRISINSAKFSPKMEDGCIFYNIKIEPKDVIISFVRQRN